jgi:hypothetical protein
VEIRIGIVNGARELSFESNEKIANIEAAVAAALAGSQPYLKLEDDKGKSYLIPTASIGFVEIGNDQARRVGFVA